MVLYDIIKLTKQLLPSGRAWRLPDNGTFRKLFEGLAESELRALQFCESILKRILPDNDDFTAEDAAEWERRLGLPVLPSYTNLEQRKQIILRKYNFPGGFLNRQNYLYIQYQLQLAGYNVYIYESNGGTIDKLDEYKLNHSRDVNHGLDVNHGSSSVDVIANSADYGELFDLPDAKNVFYIAGATIDTPAIISTSLREAFRKLVLLLKPANTAAVCNIIYGEVDDFVLIDGDEFALLDGDRLNFING